MKTPAGCTITIAVGAADKVYMVKNQLHLRSSSCLSDERLVYAGKDLQDSLTLLGPRLPSTEELYSGAVAADVRGFADFRTEG